MSQHSFMESGRWNWWQQSQFVRLFLTKTALITTWQRVTAVQRSLGRTVGNLWCCSMTWGPLHLADIYGNGRRITVGLPRARTASFQGFVVMKLDTWSKTCQHTGDEVWGLHKHLSKSRYIDSCRITISDVDLSVGDSDLLRKSMEDHLEEHCSACQESVLLTAHLEEVNVTKMLLLLRNSACRLTYQHILVNL